MIHLVCHDIESSIESFWKNVQNNISKSLSIIVTMWKVSVFGVILVRIFLLSDWIREILRTSLYSVRMWENADQNNFEYGHYLRNMWLTIQLKKV